MIKACICAMLAVLLAAGGIAADSFAVKDISCSLQSTLVPQYDGKNSRVRNGAKNRWLRLFVKFVPALEKAGEGWYDDVTMEGSLVLYRPGKRGDAYVVLSGKTRYFTIQADGKEHFGAFYVPPAILARYCGDSAGALKAVRLFRVAFYGPGRVLLGEGYWSAPGGKKGELLTPASKGFQKAAARMKQYENPQYANVTFLRGGLYSKERTPWVYFDYDLFDLIYDDAHSAAGESIRR